MKKTQLTALLLFAAMLASCSSGGSGSVTTAMPAEDTTPAESAYSGPMPELPDKKYEGETFTFYLRANEVYSRDMYVEEADGDVMNDAVFARNSAVAEQYGVKIEMIRSADPEADDAANTILAGDDAYDVLVPHAFNAFDYAHQGLLLDWKTELPYVDLDKPWWNQDAKVNYTICDKLFVMIGDISYRSAGSTVSMLFNKNLFDEYKLEYPYQTVLEGDWTFDEFNRLAELAIKDLNGDNKIDPAVDQIGYITSHWTGPCMAPYGAGQVAYSKDENDELYLTLNNPRTVEAFDKFFEICKTDGMFINTGKDIVNNDVFREGRALFMDVVINDTMNLRDMEDDFGIIPWPKLDKNVDKYYAYASSGESRLVVPITVQNTEMVSVILEALAFESHKDLIPLYYDVVLQTKYVRDEESPAMIDLVREGTVYTLYAGSSLPGQITSTGYYLAHMAEPNFASVYAQYEAKAVAELGALNETYRNFD